MRKNLLTVDLLRGSTKENMFTNTMNMFLKFLRGYLSSEWSRVVKAGANAESEACLDYPAERTILGSRGNRGAGVFL
jgi:hypothetical protein